MADKKKGKGKKGDGSGPKIDGRDKDLMEKDLSILNIQSRMQMLYIRKQMAHYVSYPR